MKRKYTTFSLIITVILLMGNCSSNVQPSPDPSVDEPRQSITKSDILINQLGYPVSSVKKALVRGDVSSFEIRDSSGTSILSGQIAPQTYWGLSGDSVGVADFSELTLLGEYTLCVDGVCSYPFQVGHELYGDLADAALKSYYFARVGIDIEEEFAGKWHRKGGHPDTEVYIHASAADENRPEGSTLSSPGGWYDAGDYGKYIVNSNITTWTLLLSYQINRDFHLSQNLHIPESGNHLPDILDEALVNLRWMMTMQDPNDGGLYHKLTTKNFDGFIMPADTTMPRFVVMKTTPAALGFCATMSSASRLFSQLEMQDLAGEMKTAAIKAWSWALEHPEVYYEQPEDINTGAYGDSSLVDEWYWAAAELYLLTGDAKFKDKMMEHAQDPITPKWDVVNSLGMISLLTSERSAEFQTLRASFIAYADSMLQKEQNCPYLISMDQFAWGSNSDVANDGMLKLIAFQLTGDSKYIASAQNDLDYILGRNATGYSFVTGFGHQTPFHQHNRIMGADGIDDPIPGYISGGPNTVVLTDCEAQGVVRSTYPAASYTDTQCSYSTNETAINWNAPLVFLTTGLEAYYTNQPK